MAEIKDLTWDLIAKLRQGLSTWLTAARPVMAAGSIRVCPLDDPPAWSSSSIFLNGMKHPSSAVSVTESTGWARMGVWPLSITGVDKLAAIRR